jgi:hypothetical protein
VGLGKPSKMGVSSLYPLVSRLSFTLKIRAGKGLVLEKERELKKP